MAERGYWDDSNQAVDTPEGRVAWAEFLNWPAIATVEEQAAWALSDNMRRIVERSATYWRHGQATMRDLLRLRHVDFELSWVRPEELGLLDATLHQFGLRLYRNMPDELWVALMYTGVADFADLARQLVRGDLREALPYILTQLAAMSTASYELTGLEQLLEHQLYAITSLPPSMR